MTEAKMKKTAAEILKDLSSVSWLFCIIDGPARLSCRCDASGGDGVVARFGPPEERRLCLRHGAEELRQHLRIVADMEWRVAREAQARDRIFLGVDWAKGESQTVCRVVSSPIAVAKRVMEGKFWETEQGQIAVTSVDGEPDGSIVVHAIMVGRADRVALRLGLGQEPEHVGWRVAEHFTYEEVAEKLGLEPFDDFAKRKGGGRGSGRTLKIMCQAISLASRGERPRVLVHHESFAAPIRTWLSSLTETFGPCVKRITLLADRDAWVRGGGVLLKDHHVNWGSHHAS